MITSSRALVLLLAVGLALLAAGCGSSSSSTSTTAATTTTASTSTSATAVITTRSVKGLGVVLVDGQGQTLYMFAPDKRKSVTCVGACTAVWPPFLLASGQQAMAMGAAKQALVATDPDPSGRQVVTYNGWPLYTYVADTQPGQASGQALNLNGGLWYVLLPSGQIVKVKSTSTYP